MQTEGEKLGELKVSTKVQLDDSMKEGLKIDPNDNINLKAYQDATSKQHKGL